MIYVQGVVRRDGDAHRASRELGHMLEPMGTFPWERVDREGGSPGGPCCALAATAGPGADGAEAAVATNEADGVTVAADLLIEDAEAARSLGVEFARHPSAVVAAAYRRHGEAVADRLHGEGVVLVWDHRARELICWRDVAGVRPLYYHLGGDGTLAVSSDLRALVAHPWVRRRLDLAYVKAMLTHGPSFTHPSRTLYQDVFKLPAAHLLTFDGQRLRIRAYWRASQVEPLPPGDPRAFAERGRELVEAAVHRRLPLSPAPVASHLSGGLDSSSIAVLTGRACGTDRVTAYSWAPPWDSLDRVDDDERPLAETVAAAEGLRLRFTDVEVDDLVDHVTRDLALLPTTTQQVELAVARHAVSTGTHTLLSGWGGDELLVFNGRGYFADLARRGRLLQVHRELRARARLHDTSVASGWRGRVLRPLLPDPLMRALERRDPHRGAGLPSEVRSAFAAQLGDVESLAEVGMDRERPGVRRTQVALLTDGHLQQRTEAWAAHGASIGLTYRFPLLARPVIEFALAVPDEVFFRDGWKRWLYREAMAGVLPDAVRWYPHKQDNALARQLQRAAPSTREPYRQHLRDRADNPFIDVEHLLAATSSPGARPAAGGTGAAAWLAFVEAEAP